MGRGLAWVPAPATMDPPVKNRDNLPLYGAIAPLAPISRRLNPMKFFTSMLAVATLAFAAGCASTNNDSASMSAVSGTSCAASTGCCGGKEGCGSKKTEDMPSLGAVSNEKAGCCSSQKARN